MLSIIIIIIIVVNVIGIVIVIKQSRTLQKVQDLNIQYNMIYICNWLVPSAKLSWNSSLYGLQELDYRFTPL